MSEPCSLYLEQCYQVGPLKEKVNYFTLNKNTLEGENQKEEKLEHATNNLPTATFVSPGRSISVKFTTVRLKVISMWKVQT